MIFQVRFDTCPWDSVNFRNQISAFTLRGYSIPRLCVTTNNHQVKNPPTGGFFIAHVSTPCNPSGYSTTPPLHPF